MISNGRNKYHTVYLTSVRLTSNFRMVYLTSVHLASNSHMVYLTSVHLASNSRMVYLTSVYLASNSRMVYLMPTRSALNYHIVYLILTRSASICTSSPVPLRNPPHPGPSSKGEGPGVRSLNPENLLNLMKIVVQTSPNDSYHFLKQMYMAG
jgi:hypothetical protein